MVTGMIEAEMKAMNMATATATTSRSRHPLRSHLNVCDEFPSVAAQIAWTCAATV
jgi:hypothetical protein